jgi:hypothetical protein
VKEIDNMLAHFGVKGMKWGVRRRKVPKMGPSDDAKTAHKAFVKSKRSGVEALTNRELNALNQRLTLEMNYQRLSYQPSRLEKGQAAVKKMLGIGKTYNEILAFSESPGGQKIAATFGAKTVKNAPKHMKKTTP